MNKKHRVTHAGRSLTVYRWTHPTSGAKRWRYAWQSDAGGWRYSTHRTLADAEASALLRLREMDSAAFRWHDLAEDRQRWLAEIHRLASPGDERAVVDFLAGRQKSSDIGAAVAAFRDWKVTSAGELTPHLKQVLRTLDQLAETFAGRQVADIHAPDLADWLAMRADGLSAKRAKDLRGSLAMFWSWCRKQGIAGSEGPTPVERLPVPKIGSHAMRVLAPDELAAILGAVRREWRAWVVLGAFAGLRPEEIAPAESKLANKRGLRCEEIDWDFGVIRVPAVVSKIKRPRIVPMSDALRAGLLWAGIEPGMQGKVCLRNPAKPGELKRLGKILFGGEWPKSAIRHSFGSYRNAILRNLPQVAEEMGTSVNMLHAHYHNPRAEAEGVAWFAVRPDSGTSGADRARRMR
jgi:hypothetical protein